MEAWMEANGGTDVEGVGWGEPGRMRGPARRLVALIEEFRRRQRIRPDLAVRPWWSPGADGVPGRLGCVVEYCPEGGESAEVVVRCGRVTVEGPKGHLEAVLDLESGWVLDGVDAGSPETLANHLLRLADRTLAEVA
jgi:hypothetical protein